MVDMTAPYAGDFARSSELPPNVRVPVVIRFAGVEQVGQEQKLASVLTLAAPDGRPWPRKLILNKTNAGMLAEAFGKDSAGWLGQPITVWNDPDVFYKGERTGGWKVSIGHQTPAASNAIPLPGPIQSGNGAAPDGHTIPLPGAMPGAPPVGGGPIADDEIPF